MRSAAQFFTFVSVTSILSQFHTMAFARPITTLPQDDEHAEHSVTLCNSSAYDWINAAIGYWKGGEWVSKGWWVIKAGECQTIEIATEEKVYAYARDAANPAVEWLGEFQFCTNSQTSFDLKWVNCNNAPEGSAYQMKNFKLIGNLSESSWLKWDFTNQFYKSKGNLNEIIFVFSRFFFRTHFIFNS
jgi:uncharacterized membrane protein